MPRITRAKAAEVAETLHVDEDAVLQDSADTCDTFDPSLTCMERKPLEEVAHNKGIDIQPENGETKTTTGKKGGKKGGRKGKNKNSDADALNASTSPTQQKQPEIIVADENESQPSPASQAASDDLMKDIPELETSHLPIHDIRPNTSASNAVRLTRSQLRKTPAESGVVEPNSIVADLLLLKQSGAQDDPFTDNATSTQAVTGSSQQVEPEIATTVSGSEKRLDHIETPVSVSPAHAMDNHHQLPTHLPHTPTRSSNGSMSVSEDVINVPSQLPYDQLESAVIHASTPPGSVKRVKIPAPNPTYDELEAAALSASQNASTPQTSPSSLLARSTTDGITAMDALEDDIEKINAEIPEVQPSPEKRKAQKSAPVVRTTKATQARISLAHGPKDAAKVPAWGPPRKSFSGSQSSSKRITSTSSTQSIGSKDDLDAAEVRKETVIPHSKPRPMSLQFPPPPPPPKSTKALTKSNFQLPGEAVAAKFKVAKEARLAKEAENQKKKTFKARPAPSMTNKAPTVRQTSTSKARESLKVNDKPTVSNTGTKRPASVATTRPATVRPFHSARPSNSTKPSITVPKLTTSGPLSGIPSSTKGPNIDKRPSTVMGTTRSSLAPKPEPPAAASARPPAPPQVGGKGTNKGREVFNRVAQAQSAAEKEKREKEEAAKQARLAAAERGRQASREWAEKQRLRKSGLKAEGKGFDMEAAENTPPVEVAGGEEGVKIGQMSGTLQT